MKPIFQKTLAELREQVSASELEPSERAELHDALENLAGTLDDDTVDSSQLANQIYKRVLDFQQSHPTLVRMMNQVADSLAQMGI